MKNDGKIIICGWDNGFRAWGDLATMVASLRLAALFPEEEEGKGRPIELISFPKKHL